MVTEVEVLKNQAAKLRKYKRLSGKTWGEVEDDLGVTQSQRRGWLEGRAMPADTEKLLDQLLKNYGTRS